MAVIIANLSDDIRVAYRNEIRRRLDVPAVMNKALGASGYNLTVADLGALVHAVLEYLRSHPDYGAHHSLIDVTGGGALAAKLSGSLSALADYTLREIVKRLKAAGVGIVQ